MRDDGTMFVFGGYNNSGELSNEIYSYHVKEKLWQREKVMSDFAPQPRAGHSCVIIKNKLFIFGGKGEDSKKLNDYWTFDTMLNYWERVEVEAPINTWNPSERSGHSVLVYQGNIVMFAGIRSVLQELGDLYVYETDQ